MRLHRLFIIQYQFCNLRLSADRGGLFRHAFQRAVRIVQAGLDHVGILQDVAKAVLPVWEAPVIRIIIRLTYFLKELRYSLGVTRQDFLKNRAKYEGSSMPTSLATASKDRSVATKRCMAR